MNKRLIKKIITSCLAMLTLAIPLAPVASATNLFEKVAIIAAANAYIAAQTKRLDNNAGPQLLNEVQSKVGVADDSYQDRLREVSNKLMSANGLSNIRIFANPKDDINGFAQVGRVISINKGAIDKLTEDQLAIITAHEIGHVEKKHMVRMSQRALAPAVITTLYIDKNNNDDSKLITGIVNNYNFKKGTSQEFEWEADNAGFEFITKAGFNPGGPASYQLKIKHMYGDGARTFTGEIINPSTHPSNTARANNFSKKMTEYSGNRVTVLGETVRIDGKDLIKVNAAYGHYADERAFMVAGNLSKVYHDNAIESAWVNEETGAVYIGDRLIVTPQANDTPPWTIADKLNQINGK